MKGLPACGAQQMQSHILLWAIAMSALENGSARLKANYCTAYSCSLCAIQGAMSVSIPTACTDQITYHGLEVSQLGFEQAPHERAAAAAAKMHADHWHDFKQEVISPC